MKKESKTIILTIYIFIACIIIATGIKMQIDRKINNETTIESTTAETTTETTTKETITSATKPTTTKVTTTTIKTTKPTEKTTAKTTTTTKPVVTTRPTATTVNITKKIEPTTKPKSNSVFYLSDYERRIAECVVMGEAGNQPYKGQVLVAQCLFNACKKDGLQPSGVRRKYQYSGWHNNPSQSVKNAVSAVFDDGYKVTNEKVLFFYAPKYCTSKWHESQKFVCEVGGHRFFALW